MNQSTKAFSEAQKRLVGGVNSPVRAFKHVGGEPIFFERGEGAYLHSVDDKAYVDYVLSWGPLILGHSHPEICEVLAQQARKGTSFGAPSTLETALAEKVCALLPSIEKIRFVNSGTEASMSAIRLARGVTKRSMIIKFDGCYHGHADDLLVAAGSGALTLGAPDSEGVLAEVAAQTLVLPYNDLEALSQAFEAYKDQIAAVIVEPVAGNMGVVLPLPDFLTRIRSLCDASGALMIVDEVMTGFRVALGGAQSHYRIDPDITLLGKVIGGGLPCGAYGGKAKWMDQVAPLGPVYQAGTLSGNPLVMAIGLKTLDILSQPGFFDEIVDRTTQLVSAIQGIVADKGLGFQVNQAGTMFSLFLTEEPIVSLDSVKTASSELFKKYYAFMLEKGIYMAPSPFEAGFMSAAHSDDDLEKTVKAFSQWVSQTF